MGEYELNNFGGATTVAGTASLSGALGKQLHYGRVLSLNGGALWSGAGSISLTDATTIFNGSTNQPISAATINLATGQTFNDQGSGTTGRSIVGGIFNNAGTYLKNGGNDYTYVTAGFNNTGAVSVQNGTLRLAGGGTHSGSFTTAAGATLQIEGGTHSFSSNPLTNAGTLNFAGGTSTLNGNMALSGNVIVSGGTLTSTASTVLIADTLNLTGWHHPAAGQPCRSTA